MIPVTCAAPNPQRWDQRRNIRSYQRTMSERDNLNRQSDTAAMLSSKLGVLCASDDISEENLRQIIRVQGCALNNHQLSDYQFFFAACRNETVTEGKMKRIMKLLLDYFPAAANDVDDKGRLPIHHACGNHNVTLGIIELLIDAAPDSVRHEASNGCLPLHYACGNTGLHGTSAISILRILLDAYPGSERIANRLGMLPFHYACIDSTVDIVEYLYNVYPDSINYRSQRGNYPILNTISGMVDREANPEAAVDIVKFLLDCDTRVQFQRTGRVQLPMLVLACSLEFTDTNISAALEMIGVVFDAHPEAIEHESLVSFRIVRHPQVRAFINTQRAYLRLAKNSLLTTTPGENGQLPLHRALQSNARLGSIKLLVRGKNLLSLQSRTGLQSSDNSGALPLHVACMHHKSTRVVHYLIERDPSTLEAVDHENNTALHYACNGAKYETIALLLGKYDALSVSKRNAQKKLPIEVLWESIEDVDRESVEYTECMFLLLRAYPEITMNADLL